MSGTVISALLLAARDLAVFPVLRAGKAPALAGSWKELSSTAPDRVREMFGARTLNIGVDCGKSDIVVLDEDVPGAIGEVATELGVPGLPRTFTVATGKGCHVYFRQRPAAPVACARGAFTGRGVDVKGHGGYVVGPGSVHAEGRQYRVVDDAPIAPVPGWVIAAVTAPDPSVRVPPGGARRIGGNATRAVIGALDHLLAAHEGVRNDRLWWATRRVLERARAGEVDEQVVTGAVFEAGRTIGLSDAEITATMRSARRWVETGR